MADTTKLIELLRAIVPEVSDPTDIAGYEEGSADVAIARLHRVSVASERLQSVVKELRGLPEVAGLEGGVAYESPGGSRSISLESFAEWLLAQSRSLSPEYAVAQMFAAIAKNQSSVLEIVPVWGISPKVDLDIGDGMKIVPIESIPSSRLKDLLTGRRRHRFSFDIANSSPRPGGAIVKETVHGPMYESSESAAAEKGRRMGELARDMLAAPSQGESKEILAQVVKLWDPVKSARESTSIYHEAEEIAAVVALCTSRPIFPVARWHQRPVDLPLVGTVGSWLSPTNENPFFIEIAPEDYRVSEIEGFVRLYRALDPDIRKRLQTPLSRLNQGRRQLEARAWEAAAIDLGIAAEALLTKDREKDAPISFLLRARGTLLLGGSSEERRRNYSTLKLLYETRSTVAHEGSLVDRRSLFHSERERIRHRDVSSSLAAGEVVCKALVRKVIELGKFPSWEALMFGWQEV